MDAADIRQLFPGLKDTIYLNTATMNVGSAPAREAYELAVERWSAGRFDWMEAERAGGGRPCHVRGDHRRHGRGDRNRSGCEHSRRDRGRQPAARESTGENVVVAENEFVSNYYPWLLLRERGYEVRARGTGRRRRDRRGVWGRRPTATA